MTLANQIRMIEQIIQKTAQDCERSADSITLLAVSKGQTVEAIRQAFAAGIVEFGENYLQEAWSKMQNLQDLPINWHFLGALQSNKTEQVARHFSWIHSLCREKTARLLSEYRPDYLPPLNVCIQVNLDAEAGKSGIGRQELPALAKTISSLPRLKLRGLMAIPKPQADEKQQYDSLLRFSNLLQEVNPSLPSPMDTLSMGMSDDFKPAIAAGATLLRIGRKIFGERTGKTV
jgi:PLP dependent protein